MFIIGTRLLGTTNEVPGLFHVATRFFHFNFLPLVPLQSYVIIEGTSTPTILGSRQRGVAIPLDCKSISVAWGRAIGCISTIVTFTLMVIAITNSTRTSPQLPPEEKAKADALAIAASFSFLASCLLAAFLCFHRFTRLASYDRAMELASKLSPQAQVQVELHFRRRREREQNAVATATFVEDSENDLKQQKSESLAGKDLSETIEMVVPSSKDMPAIV